MSRNLQTARTEMEMTDPRAPDAKTRRAHGHWVLAYVLPLFALLVLFNAAVFTSGTIASRAFAVAFMLVIPGAALLSLTSVRPKELSVRIALSIGTSILLIMLIGLFYSLVLPHLGVARPLNRLTIVIGIDAATGIAYLVQFRKRDPLDYLLASRTPSWGMLTITGLVALLPLGAVAGAERLNNGHSGSIAVGVLVVAGVLLCGLIVFAERLPRWSIGVVLYAVASAVLLMTSMRSNYPFGFDIQSEYYVLTETLRNGIWHLPVNGDPYAAMLSITVLPASVSLATHISGIYLFKVVYPLVFSLFPVLVYVVIARWFSSRVALIGAAVLIVQGFYAAEMTGLARQEIGLLYFGLLVAIGFDESIPRRSRQVGVITAGIGMAISHYSTAYFASTILIIGFVGQVVLRRSRWWRDRQQVLLGLPVVLAFVGVVVLWNVVITHSAQNIGNLAQSLEANGFKFLPAGNGSSLLSRFLNSDVSPTVPAGKVASVAVPYYRANFKFIHPYPVSISKMFPVKSVTIPVTHTNLPASFGNLTNNLAAGVNELLLLLIGIGILVFIWRERKAVKSVRSEFGFVALGTVILLAVLRLSGTVSSLYNAPRGQVQGAPLLSVGLACVCAWMFTGRRLKRGFFVTLTTLSIALLLVSDSGLSELVFGGGGADTLVNYGGSYESNYFTTADILSAQWVADHVARGQVVYADDYASIQLAEVAKLNGIVSTVIPQLIEPGALVYADSTNLVDKTTFTNVNNVYAVYQFPKAFLSDVKNSVFSTGTTEVFR